MSLSIYERTFVSGASDGLAKRWDCRIGDAVQTFTGHESEINSVQVMSNRFAFVSGADDSSCRLWDLHADREVALYMSDRMVGWSDFGGLLLIWTIQIRWL
eukprot:TRINITY_DN2428_c0_g1_i1.p1 TRINITY_DN2428_c0_g1~~TRINITY_DN2428_c0_g1_i1.p1  ORF type:complete len:101 (-),score=3.28 TRINITY_DN2428_c0_g1_i1:60-362(-)